VPANTANPGVGSLDTFWRSAENFTSSTTFQQFGGKASVPTNRSGPGSFQAINEFVELTADQKGNQVVDNSRGMIWAVSQAAPIRRVKVDGHLHLSLGANCASGGFVGNVSVGGCVALGSQQQFCLRGCDIGQKMVGGAWSTVMVGCKTQDGCDDIWTKYHTVDQNGDDKIVSTAPKLVVDEKAAAICVEKPFVFVDETDKNKYFLAIPKNKKNSTGTDLSSKLSSDEKVLIDNKNKVFVAWPTHTYKEVQGALDRGAHVIFTPATYNTDKSWKTLKVKTEGQVILGLGLATIQAPEDGTPCIHVSSGVDGVRISGILLEASNVGNQYEGSSLLQWGEEGKQDPGNDKNPGAIHDLYCFVGGRSVDRNVGVETMVKIFSGNVVGDNLWLWRADHTKLKKKEEPNMPDLSEYHVTTFGECKCDTGLLVHGDNVTMHGLAVEHTYGDLVDWHGKHGAVYFYQSELPYDVPGEYYNAGDFAGYRVQDGAKGHTAKGLGVYSYFRDYHNVTVPSGVVCHSKDGVLFEKSFTVWLNGFPGLQSVINGEGDATVDQTNVYHVDQYPLSR